MTHTLKRLGVKAIAALGLGLSAWITAEAQRLNWLGTLGGNQSGARGVSADDSVVVGLAHNASGRMRPFRWTQSGGMEDLNITYAALLTNGSKLLYANAISPDGRYIVGQRYNAATRRYEAYLLDTGFPARGDTNRDGQVDDADLLAVLFAFGARGYTNEDINWDGSIDADCDCRQRVGSGGVVGMVAAGMVCGAGLCEA